MYHWGVAKMGQYLKLPKGARPAPGRFFKSGYPWLPESIEKKKLHMKKKSFSPKSSFLCRTIPNEVLKSQKHQRPDTDHGFVNDRSPALLQIGWSVDDWFLLLLLVPILKSRMSMFQKRHFLTKKVYVY